MSEINLYNGDCMEGMRLMPDNAYDLAIVDPPYGINAASVLSGPRRKSGNGKGLKTAFENKEWDLKIPCNNYFSELKRVSKNQVIWGANYMTIHLPNSQGWIVWNKNNGTTNFEDCELAYTSFDIATRLFTYTWNGMLQGNMKNKDIRIHPTQKPVALYKWLLTNYAKPGYKILDTHGGSMSIAIACHDLGFDLDCWELDPDYYHDAAKRFEIHKGTKGMNLFKPENIPMRQTELFKM